MYENELSRKRNIFFVWVVYVEDTRVSLNVRGYATRKNLQIDKVNGTN